jgi:hypothetical protein
MDKDLYDLPPEELKGIPTVCGSLREAIGALEGDHEFLLAGDVFSIDQIAGGKAHPVRSNASAGQKQRGLASSNAAWIVSRASSGQQQDFILPRPAHEAVDNRRTAVGPQDAQQVLVVLPYFKPIGQGGGGTLPLDGMPIAGRRCFLVPQGAEGRPVLKPPWTGAEFSQPNSIALHTDRAMVTQQRQDVVAQCERAIVAAGYHPQAHRAASHGAARVMARAPSFGIAGGRPHVNRSRRDIRRPGVVRRRKP